MSPSKTKQNKTFPWGRHSSSSTDPFNDEKWQEGVLCDTKVWSRKKGMGPPSEAVSTLTSASWDWESWEIILQSSRIEEFQTD